MEIQLEFVWNFVNLKYRELYTCTAEIKKLYRNKTAYMFASLGIYIKHDTFKSTLLCIHK